MKVNTTQLAVVLGITERRVQTLRNQAVLRHNDQYGRALFDLDQSVQDYKNYITQPIRDASNRIDQRLESVKRQSEIVQVDNLTDPANLTFTRN